MLLQVSSVEVFDPLFSPSEEAKRDFESQFTDLNEQLSTKPVFTVAAAGTLTFSPVYTVVV